MQSDLLFNIVAYSIIAVSLLLLIGIVILFLKDSVEQVPRFGVALKYLGLSFAFGALFIIINMLFPWAPFYILGMTFAGTPAVLLLFISWGFLYESSRVDAGIAIAVLGGFGGVVLGIALLVFKYILETY
jgi:hypothetical protein